MYQEAHGKAQAGNNQRYPINFAHIHTESNLLLCAIVHVNHATTVASRLNRLKQNSKFCHSERSEESLILCFLTVKSKKDSSLRSE
jgi:hypothetical protein